MDFMNATKKNMEIVYVIIRIMHENKVSISQACAILDYTKNKIAQDTPVGELKKVDVSDLDEGA